jgi:hypothetical protein
VCGATDFDDFEKTAEKSYTCAYTCFCESNFDGFFVVVFDEVSTFKDVVSNESWKYEGVSNLAKAECAVGWFSSLFIARNERSVYPA